MCLALAEESKEKDTATIVSVTGRTHPVEVHFAHTPVRDYMRGCVDAVRQIHEREKPGDVLVFLPGMEEVCCRYSWHECSSHHFRCYVLQVDKVVHMLKEGDEDGSMWVIPLYAALPIHDQMQVFRPTNKGVRKVGPGRLPSFTIFQFKCLETR